MTDEFNSTGPSQTLFERLSDVLDAYGSHPTRWPSSERDALLELVQSDIEARRLFHEARSLENILDHAPGIEDTSSLQARILARIQQSGKDNGPDNITVLPTAGSHANQNKRSRTGFIQSTALLAASLIIGVFVGTTEFISGFYPYGQGGDIVNLAADDDPDDELAPEEIL